MHMQYIAEQCGACHRVTVWMDTVQYGFEDAHSSMPCYQETSAVAGTLSALAGPGTNSCEATALSIPTMSWGPNSVTTFTLGPGQLTCSVV